MLTDEEIMDIRNRAKLNDNRQIDPMAFARGIERAVLAKAMPIPKQEPVAFGIYSENGDIRVWWRNQFDDQAVCNSKAKEWFESNGVDFSAVVSLYDHPQPAQAAAIPEGWQLVPVDPTPEMLKEIHLIDEFSERALIVRYKAMLSASPKPE